MIQRKKQAWFQSRPMINQMEYRYLEYCKLVDDKRSVTQVCVFVSSLISMIIEWCQLCEAGANCNIDGKYLSMTRRDWQEWFNHWHTAHISRLGKTKLRESHDFKTLQCHMETGIHCRREIPYLYIHSCIHC